MNKRIFSLLLCLMLVIGCGMPAFAAAKETKEPVIISDLEDFLRFAENCRLDSYSQDLEVILETDLDLSETEFAAIPIFSGVLQGNGHTVSGLKLTAEGSEQGLFRYLTATAVVQDLQVSGIVEPGGSRSKVGGIVGVNSGTVLQCSFSGAVSGGDSVGGIAGVNGVTGIIENCTVDASVAGVHFVGGISGENMGVIRGCVNRGRVNASSQANTVSLSDITIESLTNSDSAMSATDIAGIAGKSSGVIRACENYGVIGHRQMGYNVGGIAGTQSGYLAECVNHGTVSGRKEVGGIVGQMEPMSNVQYSRDTLQILRGQLNTLVGMTDRASNNVDNNTNNVRNKVDELRQQADTAKDAVGVLLPGGEDDPDAVLAAQNALTESLGAMPGKMNEITSSTTQIATTLNRDLQDIANQIDVMSHTINGAASNLNASFTDVSDSDTDKDLSGKVQACVNHGEVLGDRNIGGICGAMAMENDLDPEDDWLVSGDTSMNVATELRAVLMDCENRGKVTAYKQNGGGILGWQYLGLLKNSINLGYVQGSAAEYIGGVVGRSSGYVRGNSAKSTVCGNRFVGGIAGMAEIVTDCHSMSEIEGGVERIGGVLGYAAENDEEKNPIADNYYLVLGTDRGGIDGVSYAGKAEPKDTESFLSLKEIAVPLQTVNITFRYDGRKTQVVTVETGGAVTEDMIPAVPEKQGYAGHWVGLAEADLTSVLADMEFQLEYIGENAVLESDITRENGRPVLLVQGAFTQQAKLQVKAVDAAPPLSFGQTVQEAWQLKVTDAEELTTVRCSVPPHCDEERILIWVQDDRGNWRQADHHLDGSYAVFAFGNTDTVFAVVQKPAVTPVLLVAGIGLILLLRQYQDRIRPKKK